MKQQKISLKLKLVFILVIFISPVYILLAELNANFNVNEVLESNKPFLNDNQNSNSQIKQDIQIPEIKKEQKQHLQNKQKDQIESGQRLLQKDVFLEDYLKFDIKQELKMELQQSKIRAIEQQINHITFEDELKNKTLYFDELYDIIYLQEPITGLYVTKIQSQLFLCKKVDNYQGYINQQFRLEKDEEDNHYIRLAIPSSQNIQVYWGMNSLKSDQVFLYANKTNLTKWNIHHNHFTGQFKFNFIGQVFNSSQLNIIVQCLLHDLSWLNPFQELIYLQSQNKNQLYTNFNYNSTLNIDSSYNLILQFIIKNYDNLPDHLVFLNVHLNIHPSVIVAIENAYQVKSIQPIGLFCLDNKYPPILDLSFNILHTDYGLFYTKYKQDFNHSNYKLSDIKLQDSYDYVIKQQKQNQSQSQSVFLNLLQQCGAKINQTQSWFYTSCDSSFIVSKKAVQKIPKSFYQCLLDFQYTKKKQSLHYQNVFKDIWLVLFEYESLFKIEF